MRGTSRFVLLIVGAWVGGCGGDDAPTDAVVTVEAIGPGTVRSEPPGISCAPGCSTRFPVGIRVALVAEVPNGVTFTGWSGACTGTARCVLTLTGDTQVTATFSGVACRDECTGGISECPTLTAQRTCGQFDDDTCTEWSAAAACASGVECRLGSCGGGYKLSVAPLGDGVTADAIGTVTSMPAGIQCGRGGMACQQYIANGTEVTLTSTSDATAVFWGWSLLPLAGTNGMQCVGSTAPCTVSMTEETALAALYCTPQCTPGTVHCTGLTVAETCGEHDDDPCPEFSPQVTCPGNQVCTATGCTNGFVATATTAGTGSGEVAIDGTTCAQVPCSRAVASGGSATVTATATTPTSVFTGWSGACSGIGPCVLTATGTATANFANRCTETVTPNQGTLYAIALGATSVYWARAEVFNSAIWRMPLTGGVPVAHVMTSASTLQVDGTYAYWGSFLVGGTQSLQRSNGGAPQLIFDDGAYAVPAIDATSVYYRRTTTLQRMPKAGGAAQMMADNLPVLNNERVSLLVDGAAVYWFGGGSVIAVPLGGGAPTTLAMNQGAIPDVAQDASYLYWIHGADIVRVAKAGGAVAVVVAGANASSLAVRGTTLVWIGLSTDWYPFATRIGSGVVAQLSAHKAKASPRVIVLDDTWTFFLGDEPVGDTVVRLARSPICAPP
ncbi:MAG: hypothetical protein ABMA25_17550 [Ilumatobacteraceae bacterium]